MIHLDFECSDKKVQIMPDKMTFDKAGQNNIIRVVMADQSSH